MLMLCLCYAYVMLVVSLFRVRYFGAFLANKESEDDNSNANPFPDWQMFAENAKHEQSREDGTDVIKDVRARNAHIADAVAEKYKCRYGTERREIGYAGNGCRRDFADNPLCVGIDKCLSCSKEIEEYQAEQLYPENDGKGAVFFGDFLQYYRVSCCHADRYERKRDSPVASKRETTATSQNEQNHAGRGNENTDDIPDRYIFTQEKEGKNRRDKRIGAEKRFGNSRCGEEFVTVSLHDKIEKRLEDAAQHEHPNILFIKGLQAENGI